MDLASIHKTEMKVFLVEDNEDTRLMLTELLKGDGFEVHAAATMEAALLDSAIYDSEVLLSDLGLPDGNGMDLLRTLRQAGASPYAIAMSGFGTSADMAASRAAGFRHHLVKPIELAALEGLLETARREVKGLQ